MYTPRPARASRTGGVTHRANARSKRWTFSANAGGYGLHAGMAINSKAKRGVSRAVAPSSTSTTVSQFKPRVSGGVAQNNFTIENRELLSSVIWQGTDGFELTEYAINPGLSNIFAYASRVSTNYTRYAMQVSVMYAPSVPSTVNGQIAFAMDRDNTAVAPSSMQQVLSYENNVVTSLWKNVNFPTSGMFASSEKLLYLRYGPLDDFSQINLYDLMKIYIILNGVSGADLVSGQSLGSAYITYKITFFNQKLQDVVETNIFSVMPKLASDVNLGDTTISDTGITDKGAINYQYGFGDGDVQVGLPDTTAGTVFMVFPSAGYYSIDTWLPVGNVSGAPTSAIYGQGSVYMSEAGTDVQTSDGTGSPAPIYPTADLFITAGGTSAFPRSQAHTGYIIRVLASGSYLGETGPVGEGWIQLTQPNMLFAINASSGIGTAVYTIANSFVIVNRVSNAEASFYYPLVFPVATAEPAFLLTHRRKFHPVRGHARSGATERRVRRERAKEHKAMQEKNHPPLEEDSDEDDSEFKQFLQWKKSHQ